MEPAWVQADPASKGNWRAAQVSPSVGKPDVLSPEDLRLVAPGSAEELHSSPERPPYLLVLTFEGVLASFERQGSGPEAADFYEETEEESEESEAEGEKGASVTEREQDAPAGTKPGRSGAKRRRRARTIVYEEAASLQAPWVA